MTNLPDHELIGEAAHLHVETSPDGQTTLTAFTSTATGRVGYLRLTLTPGQTAALAERLAEPVGVPAASPTTESASPGCDLEVGRIGADAAAAALDEQLDRWLRSGKRTFSPKDLAPLLARIDLADPRLWFYRQRERLTESGVIESGGYGRYDIVRSPLLL